MNKILSSLKKEIAGLSPELISLICNDSKLLVDNLLENNKGDLVLKSKKIDKDIENLLMNEITFERLRPDYLSDQSISKDFLKTIVAIGISSKLFNSSSTLKNLSNEELNIRNYKDNYKTRIGDKLLLLKENIKSKSIDELNGEMSVYINLAIRHINKYLNEIITNDELRNEFKSPYFDKIHYGEGLKTFYDFLSFYLELEMEKQYFFGTKNLENKEKYKSFLSDIEKGQYEIQRIMALTSLYIDSQRTLNYKHALEEQDYLISKLASFSRIDSVLKPTVSADNPLYNMTRKHEKFWIKDRKTGSYITSNVYKKGYKKLELDGLVISGKKRKFSKNVKEIELIHIGNRIKKDPYSSINKFFRKNLSSFDEILDHKGFIFVVDDYNESTDLIRVIENEMGTLRTSWLEEPKSVLTHGGNNDTDSDYNTIKGVLKVNYGGKLIKQFFTHLSYIFDSLDLKKFNNELLALKKLVGDSYNFTLVDNFIEGVNNEMLLNYYNDLRTKFGNKNYNITVEIQIFDLQNYIKAEADKGSSAFHGHYKKLQDIKTMPYLFPKEIYSKELLKRALKFELSKTKKYKT